MIRDHSSGGGSASGPHRGRGGGADVAPDLGRAPDGDRARPRPRPRPRRRAAPDLDRALDGDRALDLDRALAGRRLRHVGPEARLPPRGARGRAAAAGDGRRAARQQPRPPRLRLVHPLPPGAALHRASRASPGRPAVVRAPGRGWPHGLDRRGGGDAGERTPVARRGRAGAHLPGRGPRDHEQPVRPRARRLARPERVRARGDRRRRAGHPGRERRGEQRPSLRDERAPARQAAVPAHSQAGAGVRLVPRPADDRAAASAAAVLDRRAPAAAVQGTLRRRGADPSRRRGAGCRDRRSSTRRGRRSSARRGRRSSVRGRAGGRRARRRA